MVKSLRRAAIRLLGVACLLSSAPSYADELKVLTMDPSSGAISGALPFDLPFILKASLGKDLPKDTMAVHGWYRIVPACEERRGGYWDETACGDDAYGCATSSSGHCAPGTPDHLRWKTLPSWIRVKAATPDAARIQVPPLQPDVHYQFSFSIERKLSEEEEKKKRAELRAKVEPIVKRIACEYVPPDSAQHPDLCQRPIPTPQPTRGNWRPSEVDICWLAVAQEHSIYQCADKQLLKRTADLTIDASKVIHEKDQLVTQLRLDEKNLGDALEALTESALQIAYSDPRAAAHLSDALRAKYLTQIQTLLQLRQGASALATAEGRVRWNQDGTLAVDGALSKRVSADTKVEALKAHSKGLGQFSGLVNDLARVVAAQESVAAPAAVPAAPAIPSTLKSELKKVTDEIEKVQKRLKKLTSAQTKYEAALAKLTKPDHVTTHLVDVASQKKRVAGYKTNASNYMSLDVGIALHPKLDSFEASPYVGANIYFRPVTKDRYLTLKGGASETTSCWWCDELGRRTSIMLGTTLTPVELKGRREGLIGDVGVLTGIGLRAFSYLRLGGGAIWFQKVDPNPLVSDKSVTASYFFSASIDIDVASLASGVAKQVFPSAF